MAGSAATPSCALLELAGVLRMCVSCASRAWHAVSGSMCDTGTEVPTWVGVLRTRRWDVEMLCVLGGADAYYVTELGSLHDVG